MRASELPASLRRARFSCSRDATAISCAEAPNAETKSSLCPGTPSAQASSPTGPLDHQLSAAPCKTSEKVLRAPLSVPPRVHRSIRRTTCEEPRQLTILSTEGPKNARACSRPWHPRAKRTNPTLEARPAKPLRRRLPSATLDSPSRAHLGEQPGLQRWPGPAGSAGPSSPRAFVLCHFALSLSLSFFRQGYGAGVLPFSFFRQGYGAGV